MILSFENIKNLLWWFSMMSYTSCQVWILDIMPVISWVLQTPLLNSNTYGFFPTVLKVNENEQSSPENS